MQSTDTIGTRIRAARGRLTQEAFARLVGVSALTPSKWERGVMTPNLESIERIAAATGHPVEFFTEALPSPEPHPVVLEAVRLLAKLDGEHRATAARKRQYIVSTHYAGICRRAV
jgi:transcriptional regulator with XRE-family HTH domain